MQKKLYIYTNKMKKKILFHFYMNQIYSMRANKHKQYNHIKKSFIITTYKKTYIFYF